MVKSNHTGQPEPVRGNANAEVEAGDVQAQRRRRSLLGWAAIVAGAASFLAGSLVLLILIGAYLSSVPAVTDNPVGLVTVLIFCPLPLPVAGSILLIAGFLAIRHARGREATGHVRQSVGLPTFKYHSDPIATGSIIPEEVEAYGPELVEALRADAGVMSDKNWQAYYQALDKKRGPTAYVFRRRHCGRVGGYSDSH